MSILQYWVLLEMEILSSLWRMSMGLGQLSYTQVILERTSSLTCTLERALTDSGMHNF